MICVKDAAMDVVHLSPEWHDYTGMTISAALGRGWLGAVHPEDRPIADAILEAAARERIGYTMIYRLLRRDGTIAWISDGAVASFTPDDRRFIGLLGSLTEIPSESEGAHGTLGRFDPPPPAPSTLTHVEQDLATDHILLARAIADRDGDPGLVEALDVALYLARRRLGHSMH